MDVWVDVRDVSMVPGASFVSAFLYEWNQVNQPAIVATSNIQNPQNAKDQNVIRAWHDCLPTWLLLNLPPKGKQTPYQWHQLRLATKVGMGRGLETDCPFVYMANSYQQRYSTNLFHRMSHFDIMGLLAQKHLMGLSWYSLNKLDESWVCFSKGPFLGRAVRA